MVAKLVTSANKITTYGCDHATKEIFEDRIEVTLHHHPPRDTPIVLTLPKDGIAIYYEDMGKTVDAIKWPISHKSKSESDKGETETDLLSKSGNDIHMGFKLT